mmetsp:Transcript_34609/g.78216  ORF Transcript_34609/g.78216 Transcript_34609/m.78216 type:complete len:156 (+) Transcript_34609:56-523(+)|eukprot:CAMPEP_0197895120 /NCGR_PEP_ID=MMETSP1439-20131203/36555_1 /TAXON_ID=66791 /ORGANISM="Gonyaulax spinifera, Strain CCMP409" /LENGTH=155 /DNA_ID=CAMNT_0043515533 /DNA_START=56 /DNA_END=523 /DNA_ORIENTATION=-
MTTSPLRAMPSGCRASARRSRSGLAVGAIFVAVLAACRLAGAFVSPRGAGVPAPSGVAGSLRAGGGRAQSVPREVFGDEEGTKERKSESDDGFIMPATAEEEKAYQEKEGFWRSDFDELSDGEKLGSPIVVVTLVLTVLPFLGGSLFLILNSADQ